MESATPSLLGLPAELVVKIIETIPPQDHFNLALTCRRLYRLSDDVLQLHIRWHRLNSLSSDLHPLTVPQLLENTFFDPIAAWHIRDLEFWGLRTVWSEWRIQEPGSDDSAHSSDDDDEPIEPEILVEGDDPGKAAYVFTEEGNSQLVAFFTKAIFTKVFRHEDEYARSVLDNQIMKGREEQLKLLLMALAPQLRSIKFPNLGFSSTHVGIRASNPLAEFSDLCYRTYDGSETIKRDAWPPGFRSLSSLSIGVRTSRERGFIYPFFVITPFFLLPNLEYIYIDSPHSGYDHHGPIRIKIPRRISPVQHVHITRCELQITGLSEMLAGIAALKSFSLQSQYRNGVDVMRLLAMHHTDTLEYLDMCDTDLFHRLYESYFSRLSMNGVKMFSKLKYIAIDLLVLLHQCTETQYSRPGQLVILKPHADVDRVDLASILPPSIELIAFKVSSSNYTLSPGVADAVSKLVAKTIQSGVFPNLRAVFFEDISPQKSTMNKYSAMGSGSNDVSWFMDAIVAGSGSGVEICTAWTHPGREIRDRQDELGIPRAVSARDMRTDGRNR